MITDEYVRYANIVMASSVTVAAVYLIWRDIIAFKKESEKSKRWCTYILASWHCFELEFMSVI